MQLKINRMLQVVVLVCVKCGLSAYLLFFILWPQMLAVIVLIVVLRIVVRLITFTIHI